MTVLKALTAYATQDGGGVKIKRVPGFDGQYLDPFLMLDELRSDNPDDYMGGFPPHPHRGIETFTYIIKGGFEHRDQMGNKAAITAGNVQWMSTGSGVVHSEMPLLDSEGLHGFQIWVNMPAKHKMDAPRYQDSSATGLPEVDNQHGVTLRALAGQWQLDGKEIKSPVDGLASNAALADVSLAQGAQYELAEPQAERLLVYIHTGELIVEQTHYPRGKLLVMDPKAVAQLVAAEDSGFLVMRGTPLQEPIAHMGPFVMNTQAQLKQAVEDYQNGRFGNIGE